MSRTAKELKKIELIEAREPTRPLDTCCWECSLIYFLQAEPGYSEYTPGSDFNLSCHKGHWELDTYEDDASTMGRLLRLAARCPDFEPHKTRS